MAMSIRLRQEKIDKEENNAAISRQKVEDRFPSENVLQIAADQWGDNGSQRPRQRDVVSDLRQALESRSCRWRLLVPALPELRRPSLAQTASE